MDLPVPHPRQEERGAVVQKAVAPPPVAPATNAHGAAEAAGMRRQTVPGIREAVLRQPVERLPAVKRVLPPAPAEQRLRGAWQSRRHTAVGFCCARFRDRREPVG